MHDDVIADGAAVFLTVSHHEMPYFRLHIITRRRLIEFARKYPDARAPLNHWYSIVDKTDFASFVELWITFPSL